MRHRRSFAGPSRALGFTLLEILVVMGLIALVLGIVANKMADGAMRGKVNATKIAVDSLAGKIETYSLDVGGPPSRLEDLLNKPGGAKNWNGPYAKEAELRDPWQHPYSYRNPGQHGAYDLYSFGPDGKEGGDGLAAADIGNW